MSIIEEAKKHSDHHARVTEWELPILRALAETPKGTPMLEIGVQNGGSLLYLMSLVSAIDPSRIIISVDVQKSPGICQEWADRLNLGWKHFESSQRDFVLSNRMSFAYANFDADHRAKECQEDIRMFTQYMIEGGILVKDDVDQWDTIPEFEGMKRIVFDIDEGTHRGKHGHHTASWRKLNTTAERTYP